MILKSNLTHADAELRIEMTRYLFDMLGLKLDPPGARFEDSWMRFWHPTRIVEWPWALTWFEEGNKVFDVGSDPLFSLLLLREGVTDVTLHHTSVDAAHLGRAPIHGVGWVSLERAWKANAEKLKMVYGYPHQLDLASEIYDVIFNLSVMEHVEKENWFAWMEATWRMLKPGGLLVMTCDYLLNVPEGDVIDIINHPFNEYFEHAGINHEILTPTAHIPWHADFDPTLFEGETVIKLRHPANRDGFYTVYGFVVRKGE